jgi:AcrR family transcriptional regulator
MSPRSKKLNDQMRNEAMTRITHAALKVFAEHGYHGTTMHQIMQTSGLSTGLFYHYFPSKEKLFIHLVDSAFMISRDIWIESLTIPGTAWEKILSLSDNLVKNTFTEESSLYFLIMLQATTQELGIPGLMELISQGMAYYVELPKLIREAQKSGKAAQGDPDVLAATYIALYQGYVLLLLHDEQLKKKITPDIFSAVLRSREQPD